MIAIKRRPVIKWTASRSLHHYVIFVTPETINRDWPTIWFPWHGPLNSPIHLLDHVTHVRVEYAQHPLLRVGYDRVKNASRPRHGGRAIIRRGDEDCLTDAAKGIPLSVLELVDEVGLDYKPALTMTH